MIQENLQECPRWTKTDRNHKHTSFFPGKPVTSFCFPLPFSFPFPFPAARFAHAETR